MNKLISLAIAALLPIAALGCDTDTAKASDATAKSAAAATASAPAAKKATRRAGQNSVVDVALGSKDHTTLVAALQAADYVDSLDNAGPFTVFAPTNAAFDKLPAGTVEGLVKPDKHDDLRNILKYHVTVTMYSQEALTDGMVLGMANGKKATIKLVDGKPTVNGANILGSAKAANGIVHIIDTVLLPPAD